MDLLRSGTPFQLQKRIDDLLPIVKDRAEFAATFSGDGDMYIVTFTIVPVNLLSPVEVTLGGPT
jgi:hypothetical protein